MSIITDHTIANFTETVSQEHHAMAGAVIAASAAMAAALGLACMKISHDGQNMPIPQPIERMAVIQSDLLDWCDRDATAIADYVALRDAGETLAGQRLLCSAPATVSRLSIEAANILQDFRPLVSERVLDDL